MQTPPPSCAPDWQRTFGNVPGLDGQALALTVFDDGTGPALYACGEFEIAGGGNANHIAKWNGAEWSALGGGIDGQVRALTSFDDGNGPALYAGGTFATASGATVNNIAKWDGSSWSALGSGTNGVVNALGVFDDGNGPALFAGGSFLFAGGISARSIAKWDGSAWSPLGSGIGSFSQPGSVNALEVFDDGSGPALYAAGSFYAQGSCISRWNGATWTPLAGGGFDEAAYCLTTFDDGSGPALYAGGRFTLAGGGLASYIAKWNGANWSPLGSGMTIQGGGARVEGLTTFDDGTGIALYACGGFTTAGGVSARYVARWKGSSWSNLAGGTRNEAIALTVFDDGSGAKLYVGGAFVEADGVFAWHIASWNGASWSALGSSGLLGRVWSTTVFDDGAGPALYAVGDMQDQPSVFTTGHIAKWNGTSWSSLGLGLDFTGASVFGFDDGTGPALYAGGYFANAGGAPASRIAKWNGTSWSSLGQGANASVLALTAFDDGGGPVLFAGGEFTATGGIPASHVARWNGTSWSALGSGTNGLVNTMTVFDDGSGPALYVGGTFTAAGGVPANFVARWNGASWSALGSGLSGGGSYGSVRTLIVFDDGTGPALYAGGSFTTAGGVSANCIARWDGSTWSALGSGIAIFSVNLGVYALAAFDDGSGPTLYAGGQFTDLGGNPTNSMARWSGTSWDPIDNSPATDWTSSFPVIAVNSLSVFDDGQGPGLCVGGIFERSPAGDAYIAKWANSCASGWAFCFGDGSGTACPCGNTSNPNNQSGCVNSHGRAGRLIASGSASLSNDTLVLSGSGMTNSTALYFQGSTAVSGGAGVTFGDGLRCAGGTTIRLGLRTNVAGASQLPSGGGPTLSSAGLVGTPSTRTYQIFYRDAAPFCTSATYNTSNGWAIHWVP
jgi:trimeric autotransporter adhesin